MSGQQLTSRELDILRIMAMGKSVPEIASDLYLSPNTVAVYMKSIRNKFGVNHAWHALALAVQEGLVEAIPPDTGLPNGQMKMSVG